MEGFMTNDSFPEIVEGNSAAAFVKFPIINIKGFNGEPDSFECAIDKNDILPDIQKVNYLKNLAEGKAATITSNIKFANENYKICLSLQRVSLGKLLKVENRLT